MFSPVEPVRAYERIVQQIEEAISSGRISPGDRLPSERELTEQFHVSRATVREALRVLQSAGLVRSRPGDPNGAEVLPLSTTQLKKSLSLLARAEHITLADLLQFRMVIESSVCELAARLGDEHQFTTMERQLEEMERAIGQDPAAFGQADLAFHTAVANAAGSTLLQACHEVVHGAVLMIIQEKLTRAKDSKAQMAESLRRHRLVFAAIQSRDSITAARLTRKHQFEYYSPFLPPAELGKLEALRNWADD